MLYILFWQKDEFIYHPSVVAIAKEFSNRTTEMIKFVSTRLEKKEVKQNLEKIFTLKIRKLLNL